LGSWGDDIGLLYLVLLNAAVLLAAWRLARRRSADALDAAGDTFLLFYFVQYVSVCLTGVAGAMHALTIGLVALLMSALIALGSWRIRPREGEAAREAGAGAAGRGGASDGMRDSRAANKTATSVTSATLTTSTSETSTIKTTTTTTTTTTKAASSSSSSPWRDAWRERRSRAVAAGAILFVVGYVASLVLHQRTLPVISNDAITYHLPAAVQWLQTGRMGLYEAWYYNPANSYSPLGGSVFLTWLMAPMQNDSIARFVGVGPLLMLLIAMLNLCRRFGMASGVAALVAATCALARPFASQAILAKDDLFVAAFFVLAVDALSRHRLSTRSGPFRAGIALGLLLAMKYTVLFSVPLLFLMFNRAWTIRRLLVIAGVVLLVAGPWYLRNVRLTGNPLYPAEVTIGGVTVFAGMMDVARSKLLATPRGAWDVFVAGYYGLTRPMTVVLIVAWVVALIVSIWMWRRSRGRRDGAEFRDEASDLAESRPAATATPLATSTSTSTSTSTPASTPTPTSTPTSSSSSSEVSTPSPSHLALSNPLVRTCVFGPVIGIAIFIFTAPYGEMRFAYPSVALLFACMAIALRPLPWAAAAPIASAAMLLAAYAAFHPALSWIFIASGAAVALPGMLIALTRRRTAKRTALALGGVATVAAGMYAYVYWVPYVRQTDADSAAVWSNPGVYGAIGELWQFVRAADDAVGSAAVPGAAGPPVPRGATIAYANTFFTYPLMGYRYDHRVVHVPTRRDIERFHDLPRLPAEVTGEGLVTAVVAELRKDPDSAAWLRRLRESGAQYLVVAKYDPAAPDEKIVPPELTFAERDPKRFVRVFDNDAGSVFRIAWPSP
jgi:cytoskeletal protein RodZ